MNLLNLDIFTECHFQSKPSRSTFFFSSFEKNQLLSPLQMINFWKHNPIFRQCSRYQESHIDTNAARHTGYFPGDFP